MGGSASSGGGAGGGAGTVSTLWMMASQLGPTVPVTIGLGGDGGVSQTTGTSNGIAGSAGNSSTFGSWLTAPGGGGGGAGVTGTSTIGPATIGRPYSGMAGGAGSNATGGLALNSTLIGSCNKQNDDLLEGYSPGSGGGGGGGATKDGRA